LIGEGELTLKLGVFGTFYPEYGYVGNCTTAIAIGLAQLELIDRVTVFCQEGARFPPFAAEGNRNKIELIACWRHNDPFSLLRAARTALRKTNHLDAMLFNTFVTAYGRSNAANAVGLVLPPIISSLSRIPTFVYMHNFMETQEVEKLGYSPARPTEWGVRFLERLLLRSTVVVVPLVAQSELVKSRLGFRPNSFLFPYLESYLVAKPWASLPQGSSWPITGRPRILLMGSWGPQKDLSGALEALNKLSGEGCDFEITIIGAANPHFPGFLSDFDFGAYPFLENRISVTGSLDDVTLFQIVRNSHLIVLPYHATGGYSGVMNFAAVTGLPIIAYSHAQLREQAAQIGSDVTFVQREELAEGIRAILRRADLMHVRDPETLSRNVRKTEEAIMKFAQLLNSGSQDRAQSD
jgi:glycosyltransferase involved in cell wall biosynthesis